MPLVRIEKSKGLFQENGKGFLAKPLETQAISNNAEIDTSLGFHLPVSAAQAAQAGITLKDGTEKGQMVLISNIGAQNFDFAQTAFSTEVSNGGDVLPTLPVGSSILCVWLNSTLGWSLTSQSL